MFTISEKPIDTHLLKRELINSRAGALVCFEGWVRNHNDGDEVTTLEYEVFESLALKEAEKIIAEAKEKFDILEILGVHRQGRLDIGDIAVWIGVVAEHRDPAFEACRYVIDEIKHRLPIWKKEHFKDREAEWVVSNEDTDHRII